MCLLQQVEPRTLSVMEILRSPLYVSLVMFADAMLCVHLGLCWQRCPHGCHSHVCVCGQSIVVCVSKKACLLDYLSNVYYRCGVYTSSAFVYLGLVMCCCLM